MKQCSTCKERKSRSEFRTRNRNKDGLRYQCRSCSNKVDRSWREKDREKQRNRSKLYYQDNKEIISEKIKMREANDPKKKMARDIVYTAVRVGFLIRPDICSSCNKEGMIQGHHENYDNPLDVIWLCASCHNILHYKQRKGIEKK